MTAKWKMFTLSAGGTPILINTDQLESARQDARGTRLYAPEASERECYVVAEPFELVCAMLTEQPDRAEPVGSTSE